ncbi:insulin receptor substrate 1-B-like isoform X3 [Lethenteron reissneri]|nr:insulin receptor substrate 1-B-like isoform X3 [Lethenteron reissneri]
METAGDESTRCYCLLFEPGRRGRDERSGSDGISSSSGGINNNNINNIISSSSISNSSISSSSAATPLRRASMPNVAEPAAERPAAVLKCGYLRKQKSAHRRFFVLRGPEPASPAGRLEYYESERKWRQRSGGPKRSVALHTCLCVSRRADARHRYLVALYTKDEYFAVAAESEQEQDAWHRALSDLLAQARASLPPHAPGDAGGVTKPRAAVGAARGAGGVGGGGGGGGGTSGGGGGAGGAEEEKLCSDDIYGAVPTAASSPQAGTFSSEVWQVTLKPRGLGQSRNMCGVYRLCLSARTISFVKLNSVTPDVALQLMNIRRCGHSENLFFIELGRSAVTGPGEFWMQVEDCVVAQNLHETILEAMKAMGEFPDFRPRSKSHSASSSSTNPISVPQRRHMKSLPPSKTGLTRRSRTESLNAACSSPATKAGLAGIRVRTASEGDRAACRPYSVAGSPVSVSPTAFIGGYPHSLRKSSKLQPLLNVTGRSVSVPAAPSPTSHVTSPVSMSSTSSGLGSTTDTLYARPSSTSVSGSYSDGGFISSDEYGSSPIDFKNHCNRSATPESLGRTPPVREEQEPDNYMSMDPGCGYAGPAGRAKRSSVEEVDGEKAPGLHSKRGYSSCTAPPLAFHQKPSQAAAGSLEEYTPMTPGGGGGYPGRMSYSVSPRPASLPAARVTRHEEYVALVTAGKLKDDDGYMPMSPGVAQLPPPQLGCCNAAGSGRHDDYVPMSPKSVSAPQQIVNPRQRTSATDDGYMMMSPGLNGGNFSPDAGQEYVVKWANASNPVGSSGSADDGVGNMSGHYMNMSPGGVMGSTPEEMYAPVMAGTEKVSYLYNALPHSCKAATRKYSVVQPCAPESDPANVKTRQEILFGGDKSSSSSNDSLTSDGTPSTSGSGIRRAAKKQSGRTICPSKLLLSRIKPEPQEQGAEPHRVAEPVSPGEYVNIHFRAKVDCAVSNSDPADLGKPSLKSTTTDSPTCYGMNGSWRPSPRNFDCVGQAKLPAGEPVSPRSVPGPFSPEDPCAGLGYQPVHVGGTHLPTPLYEAESDYTEMTFQVAPPPSASKPLLSPKPEAARAVGLAPGMNRLSLVEHAPGGTPTFAVSNPDEGAKVIRANEQGRRRHSSETFSSVSSAPAAKASTTLGSQSWSLLEDAKHHGSFESVCASASSPGGTGAMEQGLSTMSRKASAGFENGLNYIAFLVSDDGATATAAGDEAGGRRSTHVNCSNAAKGDYGPYSSMDFPRAAATAHES